MTRLPKHIAVVMDGNGRWAKKRDLGRNAGHKAGVDATRRIVENCIKHGVPALTLFAFSSENWRRPKTEVSWLMDLFLLSINREMKKLNENGVKVRFIGERSAFSKKLQQRIAAAEQLTASNTVLHLNIAVNYGGRWDIAQAAKSVAASVVQGELKLEDVGVEALAKYLCLADLPEPDLFIRSSGEHRISNFMMWQLAYTELYFTDVLWPDFGEADLLNALEVYATRQRRFGLTAEQTDEQERHA